MKILKLLIIAFLAFPGILSAQKKQSTPAKAETVKPVVTPETALKSYR